jgi:deazaflavin-dependent oxidoreductase (nitroreductase family)
MSIGGEYQPSSAGWVRRHVDRILAAGDSGAVRIKGRPVILLTMVGRSSGGVRKVPVMRVEHQGRYAAVGSLGGSPRSPRWVANLRANPDAEVLDGTQIVPVRARELDGAERQDWWVRAVDAFPDYADYQVRTERTLPIFLLEPR